MSSYRLYAIHFLFICKLIRYYPSRPISQFIYYPPPFRPTTAGWWVLFLGATCGSIRLWVSAGAFPGI